VIEGHDIVLKTTGATKRPVIYTSDAVSAVLTVLLKGSNGQAYTAANEDTFYTILQLHL
jgi:dTDP-D-glucose 4,6-dehydratase